MYLTKRQKEILEFITYYIGEKGYAPTLMEISRAIGLTSVATIHKHLTNLERKGAIKRSFARGRSITITPEEEAPRAASIPLAGLVAAGNPIEALEQAEAISIPEELLGRGETFALRVKGDSMIDEQIRDGDYIIAEKRATAENGETVVALIRNEAATLKKFYRDGDRIRLVPANPQMEPIVVEAADLNLQGVVIGLLRRYGASP